MRIVAVLIIIMVVFLPLNAKEKANISLINLMYKAFIYSNDIPNAYKVAQKALNIVPYDLNWYIRLGQLSLWLGYQRQSFEYFYTVYKITKDKDIQKILFLYPYPEVIKIKEEYYKEKIQQGEYKYAIKLAELYEYEGYPEKSVHLLDYVYSKTGKKIYLYYLIKFSVKIGEIKYVLKNKEFIKKLPLEEKLEIVKFLIYKNMFKEALDIIQEVEKKPDEKEYYEILAYLLWKEQKFKQFLQVIYYLYTKNEIKKTDIYTLTSYFYYKKDLKKLREVLKNAFFKYKDPAFLEEYINVLILTKDFSTAKNIIIQYENMIKNKKKKLFFKARIYSGLGDKSKAQRFYIQLLENFDTTVEEKNEILWNLIETRNLKLLKKYLPKFEKNKSMLFGVITGYILLQKIDKAYELAQKYRSEFINNDDFILLYAEILDLQDKKTQANSYRLYVWQNLNESIRKNPLLIENPEILQKYLRLSMFFELPEKYIFILSKYKDYIQYKDYIDKKADFYMYYNIYPPLIYMYHRGKEF